MKNILPLLLALSVSFGATAAPIVRNPLPFHAGVDSFGLMEPGDFNGDGHKDVLVIYAHQASRVISVLLTNGTGPFAAPVLTTIDVSYSPYAAGIGDVNEDGKTDLVLTGENVIAVMFGSGNGTFTPGPTVPTSSDLTNALTLADFNGDQNLDVAVGTVIGDGTHDHGVAIHFGNGAGSFSGPTAFNPQSVWFLEPLDVNADGKTDLLVGGYNANKLYLGNGSGGFTLQSTTPSGETAPGDFNHDGKLDLAVVGTNDSFVKVWFGNGDGSLTAGVATYPAGYGASTIRTAHLDADGHLDLLVTSYLNSVTVLRGKADGTFHAPETWAGQAHLTGDFDRDGKVDFLTSSDHEYNTSVRRLGFVRGNGDGTFRTSRIRHAGPVVPTLHPGLDTRGGKVADINGDRHPDVLIVQDIPYPSQTSAFGVMLNNGTGQLAAPILTDAGLATASFAAGDVNNDGKIDVVTVSSSFENPQSSSLLGKGDGTFGPAISFSVTNTGALFLANFTGDANLDLLVHSGYFSTVYAGNGSGTFAAGVRTDVNSFLTVRLGDLNGDGKMDWVGSSVSTKRAFVNDGSGHFTAYNITDTDGEAAAVDDFNGDGKLDVLIVTSSELVTWIGNGNGTFGSAIPIAVMPSPFHYSDPVAAVTADFDGDGKLDVAFGTRIYLGTGDGRFRSRARADMPVVNGVDAGDMDGNGSPDLVTVNTSADDVAVVLTRTTSDPTATSSLALSSDQVTGQYGLALTFTATVTGGLVPLTGAVTFAIGGTPRAIVAVDVEGKARWTTAFAAGSYEVTATYAGDENYLSSTRSITQAVAKRQTTMSMNGGPNPSPAGRLVTITARLDPSFGAKGFAGPTGMLSVRDGDTPLNLTFASGGKVTTRNLAMGSHVISVDYAGDANYEPVTRSYTQVITKPVPTLIVEATTPSSPMYAGSLVTFRAYFLSTNVTGTVTFTLNDVVQATVPLTNGVAEIQRTLPWGYHLMQVTYSGDDQWAASQGYTYADVLVGPWGTPLSVDAAAVGGGSLSIRWARVTGGVTYTLWRKKTLQAAWEVAGVHNDNTLAISTSMDNQKTWMFAVTVTDANGNVSPMSPPDLATAVGFTDSAIVNYVTPIKAVHVTELRTAIASVRTFAGLTPYSYTNTIASGQLMRASDIQEMRTALAQARSTIGLPAISFVHPALTPSATFVYAMHIGQLRAGTN